MRVAEIMRHNPTCCVPSISARTAAAIMRQFSVGLLPVVEDSESRKLVGVVTDRDLCLRALAEPRDPADISVQECMTSHPACCGPADDVRDALEVMAKRQVRRIPVIDASRRLEGIVTIADLLRHDAVSPRDLCVALARITQVKGRAQARAASASAWP